MKSVRIILRDLDRRKTNNQTIRMTLRLTRFKKSYKTILERNYYEETNTINRNKKY